MATESTPPGSNAERSRAYNRGLVLGHIRREREAGRAEIARASGLSTQAVSNIIADLLADGWVEQTGRRVGLRGQPAVTYAIRCKAGVALGVEVRPDAVLAAWIDLGGTVLKTERIAVDHATPDNVLPIVEGLRQFGDLIGAGVVMPGPFGTTGLSGLATELPGWDGTALAPAFEGALGVSVTVENDANAAAMAERVMGAGQDMATFACIYFGAGLGLGLVSDGVLFRGAFGNAGELGHIPVPTVDGSRPLEDVASRMALMRALQANGIMTQTGDDLTMQQAARPLAYVAWLECASMALSHAVQVLENLIDPEAIVLTGAMPAPILQELVTRIDLPERSIANRTDRARPRLIAGRSGRMTATLGAAALVVDAALSPRLVAAG